MSTPRDARLETVHPEVRAYLGGLPAEDDPLVDRMDAIAAERGFPIIGRQAGRWLTLLTRMIGGRRVFELGSGWGYSALYFAHGVGPGGEVHGSDGSADNLALHRELFDGHPLASRIHLRQGDAFTLLDDTTGDFDVVFMDIHKEQYPDAVDRAADRLRPGGLFLADNVLWGGRVTKAARPDDAATAAVRRFNAAMAADPRFEVGVIPVCDGLMVARRTQA